MKFKNGLLFLVFMLIFISSMVYAQDNYVGLSSGGIEEVITREPGIYKFSKSLINAAETCKPYEEDFYKNNKDVFKKYSIIPGSGLLIEIKGKTKKGNCKFKIIPVSSFSSAFYRCVITPEQQAELVAAMKSKSKKSVHKTIKYEQKLGKNLLAKGVEALKGRLDITGDEFTVLINEIIKTSCAIDFE